MTEKKLDLMHGAVTFEGAVSVEATPEGVRPWRLPYKERELFHPELIARALSPAGIRMTFKSDTNRLRVEVDPEKPLKWFGDERTWDLVVDGQLMQRITKKCSETEYLFEWDDKDQKHERPQRLIELFLPCSYFPLRIKGAWIDRAATAARWFDARPRFVAYGSSITHAKEAAGPSETWASIVARRFGMHLTNLGFGGNEHLEPSVARVIGDLQADAIMLCVTGNVWGLASLTERTYRPAVIGMVQIIRDRHPKTPIVVLSSILMPASEADTKPSGIKLDDYRRMTREAVDVLCRRGDVNLFYVHGPDLYGEEFAKHDDDGVHPNAEGQRILGTRFGEMVMPRLLGLNVPKC